MEAARRHPLIDDLDRARLASLVAPTLGGAPDAVAALASGRVNTNLRVSRGERAAVLRLYANGPGACHREVAVYGHVADTVPVPRVLDCDPDGTNANGHPWALLSWVEGVRLDAALGAPDVDGASLGRVVGSVAATLHAHRFDAAGLFRPGFVVEPFSSLRAAWRSSVERAVGDAGAALLGRQRSAAAEAYIDGATEAITDDAPVGMVHADFHPANILVTRDPAGAYDVMGVVDWEYAWSGPGAFDLGQLLRMSHTYTDAFERGVWRGYGAGEDTAVLRRAARAWDLMGLLDALEEQPGDPAMLSLIDRTLTQPSPPQRS